MSPIAVTIEMILAMLLLAALFVGIRLDRRLRALRDGEAGFAKAVAELNVAALRAEGGLAELKAATQEAQITLSDRIQDAKAATVRLQHNLAKAAETADRLDASVRAAPARPEPARPAPARADADADVFDLTAQVRAFDRSLLSARHPAPAAEAPLPHAASAFARATRAGIAAAHDSDPTVRSRARVDDELFETPEPIVNLATGGRR